MLWTGLAVGVRHRVREDGLPTDRVVLLGWVLAGLVAHAAVDGWRRVVRLLVEWLPVAALLLAYDATRGLADRLGMPVHVTEPAAVDRWLGGGVLPTVWLQQHLDGRLVEGAGGAGLRQPLRRHPAAARACCGCGTGALWGRYVRLVLALSAAGLVTYVLYPAAPPWLAAKDGVIEPIHRLSATGWDVLGLPHAGALLADSQGRSTRWRPCPRCTRRSPCSPAWCCSRSPAGTWQRVGLVAYAVLMPLVLVWAGEHYVVDTLLGALYAAAVVLPAALVRRCTPRAY